MPLQAGLMYKPTDIAVDTSTNSVYVVEQFNHRVSKWTYTPGQFIFTLDAGRVTSIDFSGGGGTNYNALDTVNIGPPTIDIANPVNATAEVATVSGGVITGITVTNPGNGYDDNNLPTVDAPTTGTPAVLVAVVSAPWGINRNGTTGQGGTPTSTTDNFLYRPTGIVFEISPSRLYLTDTFNHRLRVIDTSDGAFLASVGQGGTGTGNNDFYRPAGIRLDSSGVDMIIADEFNHRGKRYTKGDPPTNETILPDPSTGSEKRFELPHGAILDNSTGSVNICDSNTHRISRYGLAGPTFAGQFGTAGTEGTELYFPGSGLGTLSGTSTTPFADTRNNSVKTVTDTTLAKLVVSVGTESGELYFPESAITFQDTENYVLVANTRNNRVEVFSNVDITLTPQGNFGR